MPFLIQFMGRGPWEFLKSGLGVEGEWRRVRLGLAPAHLQVAPSCVSRCCHVGLPAAHPRERGTGGGAQHVLI